MSKSFVELCEDTVYFLVGVSVACSGFWALSAIVMTCGIVLLGMDFVTVSYEMKALAVLSLFLFPAAIFPYLKLSEWREEKAAD